MKIYTRTGDLGTTSLAGGQRVAKDSTRLEAYGTVDELNSYIGLLIATPGVEEEASATLQAVQNKLFNIGAYLATDNTGNAMAEPQGLGQEAISSLENSIDLLTDRIPPMHCFVLPGGSFSSAQAQVCRAVCRRAERRVITLGNETRVDPVVIRYLNRLSDYLFTLARYRNHTAVIADVPWKKD